MVWNGSMNVDLKLLFLIEKLWYKTFSSLLAFWKGSVGRFIVVQATTLKKKRKSELIIPQQKYLTVTSIFSVFLPKWLCAEICIRCAIQHSHFPGHTCSLCSVSKRRQTPFQRHTVSECSLHGTCFLSHSPCSQERRQHYFSPSAAAHLYNEVFLKHPEIIFLWQQKAGFYTFHATEAIKRNKLSFSELKYSFGSYSVTQLSIPQIITQMCILTKWENISTKSIRFSHQNCTLCSSICYLEGYQLRQMVNEYLSNYEHFSVEKTGAVHET